VLQKARVKALTPAPVASPLARSSVRLWPEDEG